MEEHIVVSAPFFVAAFWSLRLGLDYKLCPERITLRLLCFMLTTALLYLCHFVYFSKESNALWYVNVLYRYCNLAVFPLWYFYLCGLTLQRLQRREMLFWLLPALALAPASMLWDGVLVMARAVFALQVVAVLILGSRLLRSYEAIVASSYADTEPYTLRAVRWLLAFLILTALASFVANLLGREFFLSSIGLLAIPSTVFSTFIFMLGYEADRLLPVSTAVRDEVEEADVLRPAREDEGQQDQSATADAEVGRYAKLQCEVLRAMDEDRLYLQPNLKISDLALHLGSNRNYIWHAVNEGLGVSFSELVNRRRIEHYIRLAEQNPQHEADETWQRCGFTSATTFYRCFRLYKGCSPSEYFARST